MDKRSHRRSPFLRTNVRTKSSLDVGSREFVPGDRMYVSPKSGCEERMSRSRSHARRSAAVAAFTLPRPDCQGLCRAIDDLEQFARAEVDQADQSHPARARRLLTFLSGANEPDLENAVYFVTGRLGLAWKANSGFQGALVQIAFPDVRTDRARRSELEHLCEVFTGAPLEIIKRLSQEHGGVGVLLRMNGIERKGLRLSVRDAIRQYRRSETQTARSAPAGDPPTPAAPPGARTGTGSADTPRPSRCGSRSDD